MMQEKLQQSQIKAALWQIIVKDVFHSGSRWLLMVKWKPCKPNIYFYLLLIITVMWSPIDKPHVQSIEKEDTVACFQSTFFSRTIWEGDNDGRKSNINHRLKMDPGTKPPANKVHRTDGHNREGWWLIWRCQSVYGTKQSPSTNKISVINLIT